ncbi:hypothetical protein BRADI_5g23115v3, partial [Brachypodium distachyon]
PTTHYIPSLSPFPRTRIWTTPARPRRSRPATARHRSRAVLAAAGRPTHFPPQPWRDHRSSRFPALPAVAAPRIVFPRPSRPRTGLPRPRRPPRRLSRRVGSTPNPSHRRSSGSSPFFRWSGGGNAVSRGKFMR